jgi:hypothetical protein
MFCVEVHYPLLAENLAFSIVSDTGRGVKKGRGVSELASNL